MKHSTKNTTKKPFMIEATTVYLIGRAIAYLKGCSAPLTPRDTSKCFLLIFKLFFINIFCSLLESKQLVFRNCIDRNHFKIVKNLLESNVEVKNEFIKQSTSLQTTVLQDKNTQKIVIVGNTHLFYHPDADHIRILQACMATQHLGYLKNRLLKVSFLSIKGLFEK